MVELLMAMSIMVVIGGVVAGLASAVQSSKDYTQGVARATQHGRVVIERIARMVRTATAFENEPGCVVVDSFEDGFRFPDTLVVWHPAAQPANPQGPPLARELVIYCGNPSDPRQLLEITAPADSRPVSLATLNSAAGRALIEGIKNSSASQRVVLTDLLRVASVTSAAAAESEAAVATKRRGCVRFDRRLLPSEREWADFRAGSRAWKDLAWPQGLVGTQQGLRQVWLAIELQITPSPTAAGAVSSSAHTLPNFGSAALYYELSQ
jgi:Tfp pilus assembly protein PilW